MLSTAENNFIREASKREVREDGRGLLDVRDFDIVTETISTVDGSAVVTRVFSTDKVTCAIKYDVLTVPQGETEIEGSFDFSLDLSRFKNMPGSFHKLLEVRKNAIEHIFCQVLNDSLKESLVITKNEIVLRVYVDCVVNGLSMLGNFIDLLSIAVYASLKTAKRVEIEKVKDVSDETEFSITDRLVPLILSSEIENLFLSVSLFQTAEGVYCADASQEEEVSSLSSISLFVNSKQEICGIFMPQGRGGVKVQQIKRLFSSAKKLSKQIFRSTKEQLNKLSE